MFDILCCCIHRCLNVPHFSFGWMFREQGSQNCHSLHLNISYCWSSSSSSCESLLFIRSQNSLPTPHHIKPLFVSGNSNILISKYPLKWIIIYMDCQRNLKPSDVIRIVFRHFIISIRVIVGLSSVLVFVFVLEPRPDIFHIWQVIIVLWEITTSVLILLFCDLSYSIPKS